MWGAGQGMPLGTQRMGSVVSCSGVKAIDGGGGMTCMDVVHGSRSRRNDCRKGAWHPADGYHPSPYLG